MNTVNWGNDWNAIQKKIEIKICERLTNCRSNSFEVGQGNIFMHENRQNSNDDSKKKSKSKKTISRHIIIEA